MILNHAVVEHRQSGNFRLLVMTNYRYYLSRGQVNPSSLSVRNAAQFKNLTAFDYGTILQLHESLGFQVFGVQHQKEEKNTVRLSVEVYMCRRAGVRDSVLADFSMNTSDDFNQPQELVPDSFLPRVLQKVAADARADVTTRHVDLFSFVRTVVHGRQRTNRALVWMSDHLISCSLSLALFAQHSGNLDLAQLRKAHVRDVEVYRLSDLATAEFTATARPLMVLSFRAGRNKRTRVMSVEFPCFSSREMWRRRIKSSLKRESRNWEATVLPNLIKHSRNVM